MYSNAIQSDNTSVMLGMSNFSSLTPHPALSFTNALLPVHEAFGKTPNTAQTLRDRTGQYVCPQLLPDPLDWNAELAGWRRDVDDSKVLDYTEAYKTGWGRKSE